MSNKYSIGGYKIALLARTPKTVMVEGRDDKDLFEALKIEEEKDGEVVIDTSEMLNDDALSGLGAKARIDTLISRIPSTSPIREKFYGFVDREWEDLVDPNTQDALPWSEPLMTDIRLKTLGHSIENHGFSADFAEAYLRHFGKAVATRQVLNAVHGAMPHLLRAGAAFSEVVRKRGLIVKCGGVITTADIDWNGRDIVLSTGIEQKIIDRGGQSAVGLLEEFYREYNGKWAGAPFSEEAYLHSHGHIGESILWAGIGKIVINSGFSEAIGKEIAVGRQEEKRRFWHGWLIKQDSDVLAPLYRAIS